MSIGHTAVVDFGTLALIGLIALAGPLIATPAAWRIPVVVGELVAGVAFGRTGTGTLHPSNPTFTFLAQVGFALVMFVAGSHVPVRDPSLRSGLRAGLGRAVVIGLVSAGLGWGLAAGFGTGHGPLYAVLLASSSAALILPIVDSLGLSGPPVLALLAQVAVADTACIIALPLVVEPSRAGRAALGAAAVLGAGAVLFVVLGWLDRDGVRRRVHKLSEQRGFALELRVDLLILFGLAALATATHVSVMLAGFTLGLVVNAIGEPRRLARQVFGVTEGFLGPLFFVWLGASLDLRALADRPSYVLLGVCLGAGATATHALMRVLGQPIALGVLAAAQLGVPTAAVALGQATGVLHPGEGGALLLGAVITIAAATVAGTFAARSPRHPLP